MTRTLKPTGPELVEQPRMSEPDLMSGTYNRHVDNPSNYDDDCKAYEDHLASLTRYTINPSDWNQGEEIKEGEFEVRGQGLSIANEWENVSVRIYESLPDNKRRLFAIPKRKEQGQERTFILEEMIDAWVAGADWDSNDGPISIEWFKQRFNIDISNIKITKK